MMPRLVISIFLIFSTFVGASEFRTWFNTDKTKSFEARLINRKGNLVTLRLKNFKDINVEIDKLHADDQLWINQNHSTKTSGATNATAGKINNVVKDAVYDTLVFGDTRDTVMKKLYASKLVHTSLAATHVGRTGLNHIFTTREKISGLTFSLSFNWNDSGQLIEVTMQSEDKGAQEYSTTLRNCWLEFDKLLTPIYGKPRIASEMPKTNELENDKMLASHVWPLDQGGSVLLGSSKIDGSYQVVVRFTTEVFP